MTKRYEFMSITGVWIDTHKIREVDLNSDCELDPKIHNERIALEHMGFTRMTMDPKADEVVKFHIVTIVFDNGDKQTYTSGADDISGDHLLERLLRLA